MYNIQLKFHHIFEFFHYNRIPEVHSSLDRRAFKYWTKWGLLSQKVLIKLSKILFITTIHNVIHLFHGLVLFTTTCVILTAFPMCFMLLSC